MYPNNEIVLCIYLTIPVTVASCEWSFSKLKLVKTYLKSTLSQEHLSILAMLSVEHKLLVSLNYDSVIDDL